MALKPMQDYCAIVVYIFDYSLLANE